MDTHYSMKQVSFLDLSFFLQKRKVIMKEYAACSTIQHHYYVDTELIAMLIYDNGTKQFTAYIIGNNDL